MVSIAQNGLEGNTFLWLPRLKSSKTITEKHSHKMGRKRILLYDCLGSRAARQSLRSLPKGKRGWKRTFFYDCLGSRAARQSLKSIPNHLVGSPLTVLLAEWALAQCFHSRQPPTETAPLIVLFPPLNIPPTTKWSCLHINIRVSGKGGAWRLTSWCVWKSEDSIVQASVQELLHPQNLFFHTIVWERVTVFC